MISALKPEPRRWRLLRRRSNIAIESHTGVDVISLRQLSARERLRVTAPSILTTANMASGFSAVLLAFNGYFNWAAALMTAAIVWDVLDGAVARLVGATSPFGIQLDSMADLISFGLAPAILIYTWVLPEWPIWAWFGAFFWLACAGFRLARFNFTIDPVDDKRYFIGLPSPGAAAVVIATVFALENPIIPITGPAITLPAIISVVPAALMVSTVRFRSFRNLVSPQTTQARRGAVGLLILIGVGLLLSPAITGLVVAYSYVLTAPLGAFTRPLRLRWWGPAAVAPPRERARSVFLPLVEPEPQSQLDASAASTVR